MFAVRCLRALRRRLRALRGCGVVLQAKPERAGQRRNKADGQADFDRGYESQQHHGAILVGGSRLRPSCDGWIGFGLSKAYAKPGMAPHSAANGGLGAAAGNAVGAGKPAQEPYESRKNCRPCSRPACQLDSAGRAKGSRPGSAAGGYLRSAGILAGLKQRGYGGIVGPAKMHAGGMPA